MADFTLEDLAQYAAILEDPASSDNMREIAEYLVRFYFSAAEETRAADTGDERLRLAARDDLAAFSEYVFSHVPAVHHREIIKALVDPNRKRTLIVAPPSSAKSTYTSLIWPCFLLGKYPNESAIMLGESAGQVERWGLQIREIIEGETDWGKRFLKVFPETKKNPQGWTKERLFLSNRTVINPHPNLFLAGMGSTIIQGSRAHTLIMDDITGPDKARSATELEKQRSDLRNMVLRRLHPDGKVVVICTRWGAEDMAPTFIKEHKFEVLHMPALADDQPNGAYIDFVPSSSYLRYPEEGDKEKDPQWVPHENPDQFIRDQLVEGLLQARREGFRAEITTSVANLGRPCLRKFLHEDRDPVLWPERFSKAALVQDRATHAVSFRLVQQGDPTGITGSTFKRDWFRYYGREQTITQLPRETRTFQTIDPSVGKSQTEGDYFVHLTVSVDAWGNKYVTDFFRERIPTPEQPDLVVDYYKKHPQTELILVDSVAYQYSLFAALAKRNLPVWPLDSKKAKEVRLDASAVFYKNGQVFLPIDAPWLEEFISEFTSYPTGKHDDIIDAMANLLEWLSFNFDWDSEQETEVEFEVAE